MPWLSDRFFVVQKFLQKPLNSLHCSLMSLAMFFASFAVPNIPLLVNPTVYNPFSPFQPFGNGVFGIPCSVKKSLPYKINIKKKLVLN